MIVGKKTTRTITTVERTNYCDFCGIDLDHQNDGGCGGDEATIEALAGENFPECDCRSRYEIDVYAKCFVGKIIPAVEALGVKFRERDNDDYEYVDKMEG
jgi:hypothetical protein